MARCQHRTHAGNRGYGLGMVLVLSVLIVASALTIAAESIFQLNAAVGETHGLEALGFAEGAIAQTLENLHQSIQSQQSPPFGSNGEQVVFPAGASDSNQMGQVTFDRARTDVPFSTYNYNGTLKAGFQNTPVPNGTAHVIATGTSHGVNRTLEVLIAVPDFPYALATAGPLTVSGTLEVVNASDMQQAVALAQQGLNGGTTRLHPASIAVEGPIAVRGSATITGDVVFGGNVAPILPATSALPPLPVVGGHLQSGSVPLPTMPPWQPAGPPLVAPPSSPSPGPRAALPTVANPQLQPGNPYYQPSALVVSGPLALSCNVLYVDGDLTVTGGVSGQGALIATGSITINDGADLSNVNEVTLSADRDIILTGTTHNFFQGTVYAAGRLKATDITILGAFIGEQPPPGSSVTPGIELNNVTVIRVPPGPGMVTGQDIFSGTNQQGLPPVQHAGDFYVGGTAPYNAAVGLLVADDLPTTPKCNGNPLPHVPPPPDCECCFFGSAGPNVGEMGSGFTFSGSNFSAANFQDVVAVFDLYYDSVHNRCTMLSPDVVTYSHNGALSDQATFLSDVIAGNQNMANQPTGLVPPNTNIAQICIDYLRYREQQACNLANSILQPFPPQITPFTAMNPNPDSFLPDAPPLSIVSWRER